MLPASMETMDRRSEMSTLNPKLGNVITARVVHNDDKVSSPVSAPFIQLVPANISTGTNCNTLFPAVAILAPNGKASSINLASINAQPQVLTRPTSLATMQSSSSSSSSSVSSVAFGKTSSHPLPVSAQVTTTRITNAVPAGTVQALQGNVMPQGSVILSRVAVDQIRLKLGHMKTTRLVPQDKCTSASNSIVVANLPVTKKIITNKIQQSVLKSNVQSSSQIDIQSMLPKKVEKPAAAGPQTTGNKKIDLPAQVPTVTINGSKVLKVQTVAAMPQSVIRVPIPMPEGRKTIDVVVSRGQRSKSLVSDGNLPTAGNSTERRHSVNIIAKSGDNKQTPEQQNPLLETPKEQTSELKTPQQKISIVQPQQEQNESPKNSLPEQQQCQQSQPQSQQQQHNHIETITIDDDDTEDESINLKDQLKPKDDAKPTSSRLDQSTKIVTISDAEDSVKNTEDIAVPKTKKNSTTESIPIPAISIVRAETLSKAAFEESLRSDEQMASKSSSASAIISLAPFTQIGRKQNGTLSTPEPPLPNVLTVAKPKEPSTYMKRKMQNFFHMVNWRDQQIGSVQNSKMRFELNSFNLLQLKERCEARVGPSSYFEQPLTERTARRLREGTYPFLYLCNRCNCHGPAVDFVAPRFCSLTCVRRTQKKRLAPQRQWEKKNRKSTNDMSKGVKHTFRVFRWSDYLKMKGSGIAAPINLFSNPFPLTPNHFERGMSLEAIDPENCSLFCACNIVDVRGYRLKLNFDGFPTMYDFWVNADSIDIFPTGWCESTGRVLQPPKGRTGSRFNWDSYLTKKNRRDAPREIFPHLNKPTRLKTNGFKVGMHIEAEDLNDTGKICVATVADILDERIRVHFDGWDDCYDFWVPVTSPYIHPCGWHQGRQQLIVPPDYQNAVFNWPNYIQSTGGVAAPAELFRPREPIEFQTQMKLEVVDQRNPCLIRPGTVVARKGYRVQIHLDCWPAEYYFWMEDDSTDLHPIGWCETTSHELETPPGFAQTRPAQMPCDILGCRGYGNAKRFNLNVHALHDCCPYARENWRQWRAKTVKPPRVAAHQIERAREVIKLPAAKRKLEETSMQSVVVQSLSAEDNLITQADTKSKEVSLPADDESAAKMPRVKIKTEPSETSINATQLDNPDEKDGIKKAPSRRQSIDELANKSVDPRSLHLAKDFLDEYGPQYVENYHLWQKNCGFNLAHINTNPLYWTVWDVFEYVERELHSTDIAKMLFEQDIDGRALLMIGQADIVRYFKLKIGPTKKLYSLIVNLRIAVTSKFQSFSTDLNIDYHNLNIGKSKESKQQRRAPKRKHSNDAEHDLNGHIDVNTDHCDEEVVLD